MEGERNMGRWKATTFFFSFETLFTVYLCMLQIFKPFTTLTVPNVSGNFPCSTL